MLTVREIMKVLKIKSEATIYRFIKDGMPVIKVGGQNRFDEAEVMDWLKKRGE